MERITEKGPDGHWRIKRFTELLPAYWQACNRLAAYEDTGLTPQEVTELLRARTEAEKNAPLTLEELRKMDGKPVYVDGRYFILDHIETDELAGSSMWFYTTDGDSFEWSVQKGLYPMFYRRGPEEASHDQ